MSEQAKFLEGSLFKHISVMSLTASLGLMAVFLVDFVDMIFISMLGMNNIIIIDNSIGSIIMWVEPTIVTIHPGYDFIFHDGASCRFRKIDCHGTLCIFEVCMRTRTCWL